MPEESNYEKMKAELSLAEKMLANNETKTADRQKTINDLTNRFTSHPPKDLKTSEKYEVVRQQCLELGIFLHDIAPKSRELSLATTKLEEVMFWANAAIARNET